MKTFLGLLIMCALFNTNNGISQDVFKHKIGAFEVDLLSEGQQKGNISILIGASPEILEKYAPGGTFPNATNAFLLRTPKKNILIDTGLGHKLLSNLESLKITPEKIDIILLTHMHGDHIFGMLRKDTVLFPNAAVYIPQAEYDYWMSDEARNKVTENQRVGFDLARQVIAAYKDKIHLFQPDEIGLKTQDLLPGIQAVAAYGHTPGHTAYLIQSDNQKLLIWGDLTHAMAVQMPHPEIAVTYDINPQDAIRYRKKILEFVSKNNIPIAGMHIAYPAMGNILVNPTGGYQFEPFQ